MPSQGAEHSEERELVRRCLAGESEALAQLHSEYLGPLLGLLVSRGVEQRLARDVTDSLWADCVVRRPEHPALLERFSAKSSLRTWLFRVALNRATDRGRAARRLRYAEVGSLDQDELRLADAPFPGPGTEPDLLTLLRESLRAGFAACPPEDLLKLRLVYIHGLSQREVARLWDCHEATVSRDLQRALDRIAQHTLLEARKRDPRLTLSWEDFINLCDAEPLDFL